MKKGITILLLAIMVLVIAAPTQVQAKTVRYKSMTVKVEKKAKQNYETQVYWKGKPVAKYRFDRKPVVKFTNGNKLTYEQLSTRKGRVLYIEICNGVVLDNKGNGRVVNTDPSHNYISYRYTYPRFYKGDKVRTYCIYTPYNNAEDDIVERFDERR